MGYRANSGSGVIVVKTASTTNIPVSSGVVNGSIIGNVTVSTGDIVALKDQTVLTENGLYTVVASGASPRSSKMANATDASGVQVFIQQGFSSGITYQVTSNPAIVGTNNLVFSALNIGLVAESGVYNFSQQIVTASIFTDVGILLTLPSAGVWEVEYIISPRNSGVIGISQYHRLVDSSNVLIPGSESTYITRGVNVETDLISNTVRITTTGLYQFKMQLKSDGIASAQIMDSSNVKSKIIWKKISGNSPVSGQLVDYINVRAGAATTVGIGTALNFASPIVIGNIPYSAGVFTLSAGKTYSLEACFGSSSQSGAAQTIAQWRDITNNILLGTAQHTETSNNTSAVAQGSTIAKAIYTPITNVTVRFEFTNIGLGTAVGVNDGNGNRMPWASIIQIGSSAQTVFQGANGTSPGTNGFVPIPVATDNTKYLKGDGTWSTVSIPTVLTTLQASITNGQTLGSSAFGDITGASLTLIQTGTYRIDYLIAWTNDQTKCTLQVQATDGVGAVYTGSFNSSSSFGTLSTVQTVHSFIVTTAISNAIMKLQWRHNAGSSTLRNTSANSFTDSGLSYFIATKIG
jgi:hypothetical protein